MTLSWNVSGVSTVDISGVGTGLAAVSTANVSPSSTTVYALTATAPNRSTATQAVTVTVAAEGSTLVSNEGFDDGNYTGFTGNCLELVTSEHHSGGYALKMTSNLNGSCASAPGQQGKVYYSLDAGTVAGKRVRISAWMKSGDTDGVTQSEFIGAQFISNSTWNYCGHNPGQLTNEWRYEEQIVTFPSDATSTSLRIDGASPVLSYNDSGLVDDVRVVIEDPAPAQTITSFRAYPSTIHAGETVTLSWSTLNAVTISISPQPGTVLSAEGRQRLDFACATSVPTTYTQGNYPAQIPSGYAVLGGDYPSPTSTQVYTLTATGSASPVTATTIVTVIP